MIIFVLKSKVNSGHEKMFRSIYENIHLDKKYLNLEHEKLIPYLFKNKTFIVSAGYPLQNLEIIFLLKLFLKKVYVYTPFGFEIKYFNVRFTKLKEILVNFVYSGNNVKLITCSKEQKDLFLKRFPLKKVYYFNNFTEGKNFSYKIDTQKKNIYYIGRIDQKQKNCIIFSELANTTDYSIHLIGDLDDEKLARQLSHPNITIYEKMINPYDNIVEKSCIILPSFYEGAALVVIEACMNNIPIFLSNCVGNKNFADEAIIFQHIDDLKIILNKFFSCDILLYQQWVNFRENVLQNYNKEIFLTQIHDFENIIK